MGEYDISIDDLLAGNTGTKKETKLEKAKKLILELLGKKKMMCLEELEAELQAYEISARTGRDARKGIGSGNAYRATCLPPMSEKFTQKKMMREEMNR